jgi:hypothetical protein
MERADDVGVETATFLLTKAGGANAEAEAKKRAVAASVNFILKLCVCVCVCVCLKRLGNLLVKEKMWRTL